MTSTFESTVVGLTAMLFATATPALAGDPCAGGGFCDGVDYASCDSIPGGEAAKLQCCVACGDVQGQVIELGAGTFVLDPAGPNQGSLYLPPATTLRSTPTNPHARYVCARAPAATIDVRQLPAATDPFESRAVRLGAGGAIENVAFVGGFQLPTPDGSKAVPCIDLAPDSHLSGVTTENCFMGALLRTTHPVPGVIDGTIRESCFQGGNEPVVAALGWPYPVEGQHVRLGVYDTVIKDANWSLLSWIGGDGDYNRVDVYLEGTTIANSSIAARVTGGQDVNCCTPENTGGGDHGQATLVLGPGNHIDGYDVVGISVEGGNRGGSNAAGYFEPDPSSHNVATLELSCDTEFSPAGGLDVFLEGNANWAAATWPDVSVGTDNLARLRGSWSDDVGIAAVDCSFEAPGCGSTTSIEPDDDNACDADDPSAPSRPHGPSE